MAVTSIIMIIINTTIIIVINLYGYNYLISYYAFKCYLLG